LEAAPKKAQPSSQFMGCFAREKQQRDDANQDETWPCNVCCGSLADIEIVVTDVCFASKSGHVHNQNECPLSANRRHRVDQVVCTLTSSAHVPLTAENLAEKLLAGSL